MIGQTLLWLSLSALPTADGRLDIEPEDLRPGLVAEYQSLGDTTAKVTRLEPKPAFNYGQASPHPRLPAGPFAVTYTGVISIRDPGPLAFSAFVSGELTVTIDGVVIFKDKRNSDAQRLLGKATFDRPPGHYRVAIRYRALADVPARLQIWWSGPSFAAEPVPAWRLGHIARELPAAAKLNALQLQGQRAAGQFGCARCHSTTFPASDEPPPGPALADAAKRLGRAWLLHWLADPARARPDAHMPGLFTNDRQGFVERWLIAEHLSGGQTVPVRPAPTGNHRLGRQYFLKLGCVACHFVPDIDRAEQGDMERRAFHGLADRLSAADIAAFIGNPHGRYPDGRMPRLAVPGDQARDIAAYLLLWSKPIELPKHDPPSAQEISATARRVGARDAASAAQALLRERGCQSCHTGLGDTRPQALPIKASDAGCLGGQAGPRFALDAGTREALQAYVKAAPSEKHSSPFVTRQERLRRAGCVQCHQRDSERPPPLEEAGSKLGGAFLQELPFQRTPRLTNPQQKLTQRYLLETVREGNPGTRGAQYSYRMPAYGAEAEQLLQALAEADGESPSNADEKSATAADPTLGTLHGSRLAGFQGYACVSCHVWNDRQLVATDPGVSGPDLTRSAGRLRREWVDRFLENPLRYYPGTPMPSVFPHGKPATLTHVLDGDPGKQKEALWAYFALGKNAPNPKPPPPVPIDAPAADAAPIVAQIPIRVRDKPIESIALLTKANDLVIYDLATGSPTHIFAGGRILRNVQGRIRQFSADGAETRLVQSSAVFLIRDGARQAETERQLLGYDLLPGGFRARWRITLGKSVLQCSDEVQIRARELSRRLELNECPAGSALGVNVTQPPAFKLTGDDRGYIVANKGDELVVTAAADNTGKVALGFTLQLAPAVTPAKWDTAPALLNDDADGTLVRPGYRAIAYPRPKTVSGEDRVMPGALGVRPRDGRVFVASMKTGELLTLQNPDGKPQDARFERYGNGLYQDALSLLAEDDGLYVLHRRNLTKIVDSRGQPSEFVRVAALPHGIADTYDMAYGLARDKQGRFVFGYAPYANTTLPGSGGAIRLQPGKPVEEVAFGMRNPLGFCSGTDGEVFFTDNQGEWVAANKLCHVTEGHYFGFPNNAQRQHVAKPAGKTTIWVPYAWARSINGVAYDNTGGKFGPFAGQFFLAELMYGGAIIRANVEKVNGVYQGACFPFWGKGLLGPVCLAFDPRGKLYVGGITEPGWMAQPDRGALFRIDYTGDIPFEMQSITVRPKGFRITFTKPVDAAAARAATSYRLEHYRYEYTGAYGSPELDRTAVTVERVDVSADGQSVEIATSGLTKDRVYMIAAPGVRSTSNEKLVQPVGAYTLNEVPGQ